MSATSSKALSPAVGTDAYLDGYLDGLVHEWSKILTTLGFTLIPIFFVLDVFMMPAELLPRFALYRMAATAIIIGQHLLIRFTQPRGRSWLHGYFFSVTAGGMIALMTTDLGGFNSTYYAGLNLVLIAVNLLLPWRAIHSVINSVLIIGLYVALNLFVPQQAPVQSEILVNNLYFLASTAFISVSINYVKQRLIIQEFNTRADLKAARDALWGEMEVAKRIQTSLLPRIDEINGYRVAAVMHPAAEVGGDYYDLIESGHGEAWLCIGDVSGHGVESGLIMMMTQTSISTAVHQRPGLRPSEVLVSANTVLKTNMSRLGADRYVTCMALQLKKDEVTYSGKHQDVLVYRARTGTIESAGTDGVWLGVVDDISGLNADETLAMSEDDVMLLFTDGITEAMNDRRELFGEERVRELLAQHAREDVDTIVRHIVEEVRRFTHHQKDDLTLVAVRRMSAAASAPFREVA